MADYPLIPEVPGSVDFRDSVRSATTVALPANTRTGNVLTRTGNGALPTIDGVSLAVGNSLLVKDEATGANNGIYTVTSLGSAGSPWVLTRRADSDTSEEVTSGMHVPVAEGTANADTTWILATNDPITLNTTALSFVREAAFIPAGSVTNAQLANMAEATTKGRAEGAGTGSPQDLTAAQARVIHRTPEETRKITQAAHGLVVTDYIRLDIGTGNYVKALATTAEFAEVIANVSEVVDASNFRAVYFGPIVGGFVGLTPGEGKFLSTTVAGGTQTAEPTTDTQVAKFLMVAISATEAVILSSLGTVVSHSAEETLQGRPVGGGAGPPQALTKQQGKHVLDRVETSATTAGAGTTTLETVALANNTRYLFEVRGDARRTDALGGGAFVRWGSFYREAAGAAVQVGTTATPYTEADAGLNIIFTPSGNNVLVQAVRTAGNHRWTIERFHQQAAS
jgi:hypothetical protein